MYKLKKSIADTSQCVEKDDGDSCTPSETDLSEREVKMNLIVKHLEIVIMTFVKFAKSVPGFTELPLNDQATLVKGDFCIYIG